VGAQEPPQQGRVSPDGLWRWDGVRWMPTGATSSPPAGSRAWIIWLVAGSTIMAILAVGGAIFALYSAVSRIQASGITCLPPDFPQYPRSALVGEQTYFGTGLAPGDPRSCRVTLTPSTVGTVGLISRRTPRSKSASTANACAQRPLR
jgi:hypothetical protein